MHLKRDHMCVATYLFLCQCAFATAITSGTFFAGAISEVGDGANVIISESPPFVGKPT
jgi:hypothetical protein